MKKRGQLQIKMEGEAFHITPGFQGVNDTRLLQEIATERWSFTEMITKSDHETVETKLLKCLI